MSTQPLTDIELAKSGLDLTSWVLQDDLYQQDFCFGAKETHPHSADLSELAFEGLSGDIVGADGLSLDDALKLDYYFPQSVKNDLPDPGVSVSDDSKTFTSESDPMDLQELMREEILQQQKLQQLEFFREKEEEEMLYKQTNEELEAQRMQEHLMQMMREQKELQIQHQKDKELAEMQRKQLLKQREIYSSPSPQFQQCDTMEILFDDQTIGSPENCVISTVASPYYDSSVEGFASENLPEISTGPRIISVPVSEAFSASDVRRSPSPSELPSHYSSEHVFEITESQFMESEPSKPVVIAVKKVSIPSTNARISKGSSPQQSTASSVSSHRTLKQALESDDADDFIRELIGSPGESDEIMNDCSGLENWSDSVQSDSCSSVLSPASTCSGYPESPAARSSHSRAFSTVEKKLRKKEQNKRAALRYRQKKKDEEDSISAELSREEARQKSLIEKYESVRMELKLMKKLAREMLVAQGKLDK